VTDTLGVQVPAVAVLRDGRPLGIVARGGSAVALAWPGSGSLHRAMHHIQLEPGGETVPLLHESESVYFVAEGSVRIGDLRAGTHEMVFVPPRVRYRLVAEGPTSVYGGPCPPDPALYDGTPAPLQEGEGMGRVRVFEPGRDGEPLPMISREAWLVIWPGSGADVATMNFVRLEPGEENQPHAHEASDDTIAILEGAGSIDDLDARETHDFAAGDVVFVRAGVHHKVKADKGVAILSAGGPCPPDYGMLRALGLA
jgi:mannose-6-phosphate isomerase-like protein (cupin superfamily)